jgi:hypothetical protein
MLVGRVPVVVAALAVVLAVRPAALQDQQLPQPTFRTNVEAVTVDAIST